ncbi:MAG: hypothetical protein AAGA29_04280 [Planctomycetota bacterium]
MSFDAQRSTLDSNRVIRYGITSTGDAVSYAEALELLATDSAFRSFLSRCMREPPFQAMRFETPALTRENASQPFEFVLIDSPGLERPANPSAFSTQILGAGDGVAPLVFENLSGDAVMIVPRPVGETPSYTHLSRFVSDASAEEVDALFQVMGETTLAKLGTDPIWLNTAGGGVAWLHVRLDSRPKYYHYRPYASQP